MVINNILELEYAIKENNVNNIKKILKKNPEEINKIEIHRFTDMIHFNEFDLFDNILKSINSKLKKDLLSNNIIIIKLLNSNNIKFINKYIKYINLDLLHNNNNIIKFCIETTDFELVEIIYKIYKSSNIYSLLNNIFIEYKNNNSKINLELIKFLIKLDKNIFKDISNNNYTNNNVPTLAYASLTNNLELLNILKEAEINFYYEKFNILIYYFYKVNTIDNNVILYLLNNNININICDKELWLMAHIVFFNPDYFTLEVKKIILEKTNNINLQNTLGNTPLHYLVYNNNIDDYKDILIKKELDIFIKNKALYTPLSLAIIKKQNLIDLAVKSFIYHINIDKTNKSIKFSPEKAKEYILKNKTTIYNKINYDDNDIIIGDYNYIKHSKFIATDTNVHLYIIILLQKYNILGVPYLPNSQNFSNNKSIIEKKKFQNVTLNNHKEDILKFLYYSEEVMYFRIYWADEKNFVITSKIGEAIQNIFKFKKYVFIILGIYNQFIYHANVLIFDRDKKLIVHFEPHGKLNSYVGKLYETLKNYFKKELKNFKYIAPIEYLPIDAFQSMYNNSSPYDSKVGDPKGYCCAWCFWFIELYINNTKYDLKSLVNKSIKKLINTKYTFIDHIRNYANYLNNKMEELLLEYNIPNKFINNLLLEDKYINEVLNNISFNLKQLNY
jgi:ankyrin repeat protein